MSELVWIAVPYGRVEGSAAGAGQLCVVVSPRLSVSNLADAGMVQWPAGLQSLQLLVEFGDASGNVVGSTTVDPPHVRPEPGVWERFFGPGTLVKPVGARDGRALPSVEVEPTTQVAASVDSTFSAAAAAPVAQSGNRHPQLDAVVAAQLNAQWSGGPAPSRGRTSQVAPPPAEPPDFHRTIAMLREHANVLRSLGLVFDIVVPAVDLPAGVADLRLRVRPLTSPEGLPPVVSPWTVCTPGFFPGPSAGIKDGMVTLTGENGVRDGRWNIVGFDIENGAERLRQVAQNLGVLTQDDTNQSVTMPALRSVGMSLIKKDRQTDFVDRRRASQDNAARANLGDAVLGSDDLLLGYRLDVRDRATKDWLSLHWRSASYSVGQGATAITLQGGPINEEGHLKVNAAVDDGSGTLRANEVVARWDGWSLALPRPPFDAPDRTAQRQRRMNNTTSNFGWRFDVVGGSLPRLRFGRSYSVRARAAFYGGVGLKPGDAAAERYVFDEVSYRRYDPILSPELLVPGQESGANRLGPSETMLDIVIRSDRDLDAAAFATANPSYGVHHERTITPPRTSLVIAEQHGALDDVDAQQAWSSIQEALSGRPREGGSEPALADFAAQGVRVSPRPDPGAPTAPASDRPWPGSWPKIGTRTLELRERSAGDSSSAVGWQTVDGVDRLVVALAPAEQVTLDLSTFPVSERMSHFALWSVPSADNDAFAAGRHPLVTPASAVVLTHAVRKPLSDPTGTLLPVRQPNQTFVDLNANPPLLGINANSTSQLDLNATWIEFTDDQEVTQAEVPVQTVLIGRADTTLATSLRQEFSDTKHRVIAYGATAVSRYRNYFDPGEDPAAFLAKSALKGTVNVLSSARPPAPRVLSVRPSFRWEFADDPGQGRTVRRRRAGKLRLELERPWFASGAGEALAVLVWDGNGVPPLALEPFLSRVGADPIWDTNLPPQWSTAADFAGTSGDIASVRLEEIATAVAVLPFAPFFQEGHWYADIEMPRPATSSYCPFVRLAVARYQPDSIKDDTVDCRISKIVVTQMAQLLPDRELTIVQSASSIAVQLGGVGPQGPRLNRIDVLVEQSEDVAAELTALGSAASTAVPSWRALLDRTVQLELGGPAVDLPLTPGGNPTRLRIREVELIGPDDATFPLQAGTPEELTERVVYTDTVPLSGP